MPFFLVTTPPGHGLGLGGQSMSKPLVVLVSILLGVLCLLALDDITTGREPSFVLEWVIVALTGLWFAGLAWRRHRRG